MPNNPNKTITANSKGIVISFRDESKPRYVAYRSEAVKKIQLHGTVRYQVLDKPAFNRIQQKLYTEAIYGLNSYDETQLATLTAKEVSKIFSLHKKVQHFLNKWKQELIELEVNKFLLFFFPNSKCVKHMCSVNGYNRAYIDRHTFRELGLTQEMIASKLIEAGFLPKNFFQLT
jgi:hypothetical protein